MTRNLESRIIKLETRTARPDEMLVVWRRPDGSVAEALKDSSNSEMTCPSIAQKRPLVRFG